MSGQPVEESDGDDDAPVEAVPGQVVVLAGPAPLPVLTGVIGVAPAVAGLASGEPFTLFLAMAYRGNDTAQTAGLSGLVDRCLHRGMFAASTWGPGCEVVHDAIDWADIERHLDDPDDEWPVVVTSWYDGVPVEDALRDWVSVDLRDEAKPGGRLWLALLDEDVDAGPVLAWFRRWQIPVRRVPTRDTPHD